MGSLVGPIVGAGIGLLGGGGGGGSTGYSSSQPILPEYLKSALQSNVTRAQDVFGRPFEAYAGADAVAPLSADEQTAFAQLRDVLFGRTLPLFDQAQGLATRAGERAEFGPTQAQLDPYMNPFQQGVTDIAKLESIRNWENEFGNIHDAASKVGAFGGSGQRILESESYKNIAERLDNLQMQGDFANFANALGQFNQGTGMMSQTALGQGQLAGMGQNIQLGDVAALSTAGATARGIDQATRDVDFSEFLRGQGWDQQQIQGLSNILAQTGNVIGGQSAQIIQPGQEGNKWASALGGAITGQQIGGAFGDAFKNWNASIQLDNIFASNPHLFKEGGLVEKYAEGGLVRRPEYPPNMEEREKAGDLRMQEIAGKLKDARNLSPENLADFAAILEAVKETNAGKDLLKREKEEKKYADGGLINLGNVTTPFNNMFGGIGDFVSETVKAPFNFFGTEMTPEMTESVTNPFGGLGSFVKDSYAPVMDNIGKGIEGVGNLYDFATDTSFIDPESTLGQLIEGYKFGQEDEAIKAKAGIKPASPEDTTKQNAAASLPIGDGPAYTLGGLEQEMASAPKGTSAPVGALPIVKAAEVMRPTSETSKNKTFMDRVNQPLLAMGLALMSSKGSFADAIGQGGRAYMAQVEKQEAKEAAKAAAQLKALDTMSQIQKRQMETAAIPASIDLKRAQTSQAWATAAKNSGVPPANIKAAAEAWQKTYNKVYESLAMNPRADKAAVAAEATRAANEVANQVSGIYGGQPVAAKGLPDLTGWGAAKR